MQSRSANATIKGYFYQFDYSIVQLLSAVNSDATVLVEGIEDIDLVDGNDSVLIQCKYHEGTEYNHSLIKSAIIQMFRHFHSNGCVSCQKQRYKIYGHYKGGQKKLPSNIDLAFLKKTFLTYSEQKKNHEVHVELGVADAQLITFLSLLDIDIKAKSYDLQQGQVRSLLKSQISGCNTQDALTFYYPMAIYAIQKLAIQENEPDRMITKGQFLVEVNKKEAIFSTWMHQKFGSDYYVRSIKRKYFYHPSTRVPKASRIFVIDVSGEFDVAKIAAFIVKIGTKYSHVEHRRTPLQDRFCPYILVGGVTSNELIELKTHLLSSGIKFTDGYAFNGASFSPSDLVKQPTKENLYKLKFIPSADQVGLVISLISGTAVELFEFFKDAPNAEIKPASDVLHHKIKMTDSVHFIAEAI